MSDTFAQTGFSDTEADPDFELIPSYAESNQPRRALQPPLDPGSYTLVLTKITEPEPVSEEWDPERKKVQSRFTFTVDETDPDYGGRTLTQTFTIGMNEKSKLTPIVKALMGDAFDPLTRYSPAVLKGRRMVATVMMKQRKDGTGEYPIIAGAAPYRTRRSAVQQVADAGVPF